MRWSPQIRRIEWLTARPIAHRGLHDIVKGVVENTASAFARAIGHDYAIECDLQLTADGEAVVFHDDTLERLTEAEGPVKARTARELRQFAFKSSSDRIQTLGEMLDQVAGKAPLVIELKSQWNRDEALVERAVAVLAPYPGPYALMSFDPDLLAAVRFCSPRTVRGIVTDRTTDPFYASLPFMRRLELRDFTHMPRTMPDFISYRWQDLPYPPVARFREMGNPVICWTVENAKTAAIARRYADQITFEGFLA